MDMYVIRDTYDMKFLTKIDNEGVSKEFDFNKAIKFIELEKAQKILEYLDDEDYAIEEIEFKRITKEVE